MPQKRQEPLVGGIGKMEGMDANFERNSHLLHDLERHLRRLSQENSQREPGMPNDSKSPSSQHPDVLCPSAIAPETAIPATPRPDNPPLLKDHSSLAPLSTSYDPTSFSVPIQSPGFFNYLTPQAPTPSSKNTPLLSTGSMSTTAIITPSTLQSSTSPIPSSKEHHQEIGRPSRGEGPYVLKAKGGAMSESGLLLASTLKPHKTIKSRRKSQEDDMPDFTKFRLEDQVADILASFGPTPKGSASTDPLSSVDVELSSLLSYPAMGTSGPSPSLPATIYGLAVSNPSFFLTLRRAVPPEYCAISFFRRLENQVWSIGRKYSEHLYSRSAGGGGNVVRCADIGYGTVLDTTIRTEMGMGLMMAEDEELSIPDEKWCERAFKRRIENVRRHLVIRKPLGKAAREQAFRVLLRALWEVVERGSEEREMYGLGGEKLFGDADGSLVSAEDIGAVQNFSKAGIRSRMNQQIGLYGRLIAADGVAASPPQKYCDLYLPPLIRPGGEGSASKCGGGFTQTFRTHGGAQKVEFFAISVMGELVDVAGPYLERLERLAKRIRGFGAREGFLEEFEGLMERIGKQGLAMGEEMRAGDLGERSLLTEESFLRLELGSNRRSSSVESVKRARSATHGEGGGEKTKRRCA